MADIQESLIIRVEGLVKASVPEADLQTTQERHSMNFDIHGKSNAQVHDMIRSAGQYSYS